MDGWTDRPRAEPSAPGQARNSRGWFTPRYFHSLEGGRETDRPRAEPSAALGQARNSRREAASPAQGQAWETVLPGTELVSKYHT